MKPRDVAPLNKHEPKTHTTHPPGAPKPKKAAEKRSWGERSRGGPAPPHPSVRRGPAPPPPTCASSQGGSHGSSPHPGRLPTPPPSPEPPSGERWDGGKALGKGPASAPGGRPSARPGRRRTTNYHNMAAAAAVAAAVAAAALHAGTAADRPCPRGGGEEGRGGWWAPRVGQPRALCACAPLPPLGSAGRVEGAGVRMCRGERGRIREGRGAHAQCGWWGWRGAVGVMAAARRAGSLERGEGWGDAAGRVLLLAPHTALWHKGLLRLCGAALKCPVHVRLHHCFRRLEVLPETLFAAAVTWGGKIISHRVKIYPKRVDSCYKWFSVLQGLSVWGSQAWLNSDHSCRSCLHLHSRLTSVRVLTLHVQCHNTLNPISLQAKHPFLPPFLLSAPLLAYPCSPLFRRPSAPVLTGRISSLIPKESKPPKGDVRFLPNGATELAALPTHHTKHGIKMCLGTQQT